MRRIPLFGRVRRDWQLMYDVCRAADDLVRAMESRSIFRDDIQWGEHLEETRDALRQKVHLMNDCQPNIDKHSGEIVLMPPPADRDREPFMSPS